MDVQAAIEKLLGTRPLNGFVLAVKDELPDSIREIKLPSQNSMRPSSGVVLVASDEACDLLPGDKVLFGRYAGEVFTINEVKLTILHRSEIQARIPCGLLQANAIGELSL